ncbi:hypothetical protein D0B54_20640 [Solimonas sp. K1W22B-7]|uniref:hypothetical protein n=1 Tax=Solimonas sp. K1W22B-7 TaxID=2303331 RepID=UPI000E32EED4|nr:hypothetical protein [Solimonas sp. K1W22B-7]AXQ30940.1 hypothetical protein D0B54_20640 [Solimonas sp. K1W22B-7]
MTTQALPAGRIPMAVKLGYTAFMAILVPVYWHHYGPTNFLYFCDVALFLTLAGVWLETPLLISLPAVGILASQALWLLDFVFELAGGQLTGMTAYMFDEARPLYLRGLSLFHGWLPILLVYLVMRSGYDRRALWLWTAIAWVLVWISFLFLPAPSANHGIAPVNVNYVWGFSDVAPQSWMPPLAWVATEMIALLVVLYLPVHLLLRRYAPAAPAR